MECDFYYLDLLRSGAANVSLRVVKLGDRIRLCKMPQSDCKLSSHIPLLANTAPYELLMSTSYSVHHNPPTRHALEANVCNYVGRFRDRGPIMGCTIIANIVQCILSFHI